MSDNEDYEYSTDDNEFEDEEDGYSVEQDDGAEEMDWNEVDNPNAPPSSSYSKGKFAALASSSCGDPPSSLRDVFLAKHNAGHAFLFLVDSHTLICLCCHVWQY